MGDWNASLYLKFSGERTQPAIDLAGRLTVSPASRVLDVGCGPGNSTAVLLKRFPGAQVTGIDNSPDMLARARADHPEAQFELCDVSCGLYVLEPGWDVIFSNACLQWVPDHPRILNELMALLNSGGQLAVQIPMNQDEPIHHIIAETASSQRWHSFFPRLRTFHSLTQNEYFDVLANLTPDFHIWQTTYFHRMSSHEAIMEWYRSTGLRPYLDVLPEDERPAFEADIMNRLIDAYPIQQNGEIIFRFPRFFFIATR